MQKPVVVVMPGDGIGRIVVPEALRVLHAAGFDAAYEHAEIGWDIWQATGNALPDATIRMLQDHGLGLFGAITSKPAEEAQRALPPPLREQGIRYQSPILALRRRLKLTTSVRPCRTWPGNVTNFIRPGPNGPETPAVDITVVMQNTEGLYAGIGWQGLPEDLHAALRAHPNMASFDDVASQDLALSCRLVSRSACRNIAHSAFEWASRQRRRHITLCDKWGVMQETASMLLSESQREAQAWPGIELRTENVDALLVQLLRSPERYGVILCGALVGDIVSDAVSALVGGLGFAPCANLGKRCALFEPTHGSAPDIAEREPSTANPMATILAAAMLCDHVGQHDAASRIRTAVADVIARGEHRTPDMIPPASAMPACTTHQLTDAIVGAISLA